MTMLMLFRRFTMVSVYLPESLLKTINYLQIRVKYSFHFYLNKKRKVEKYHFTRARGLSYEGFMPSQARLDAPGTLHHGMIWGIDGLQIVRDDQDWEDFLSRISQLAGSTGAKVLAGLYGQSCPSWVCIRLLSRQYKRWKFRDKIPVFNNVL
jgi:hypothetical protein